MFRDVFDCESYSLVNKSLTYGSREAHTLGRCKKDVAQSFGVRSEWDGTPPLKVFQFLRKIAKACDDNDVSEAEAFFMLQDFTKEPLRSEVMSVMPSRHGGNPGEVNSYLELINWMLRYHADEASLAAQVEEFNRATQTPGESERTFAERLRQLNVLCGFIHPQGVIKGRFVEGVHRAARVTVRERNTPSMTLAELARIAQTKGDEYRWIVSDQRREREKEARTAEAIDQVWRVEVLNTSKTWTHLPKGMKIASISTLEGNVIAVTQQQLDEVKGEVPPRPGPRTEVKLPTVHRENVPAELHQRLDELIQKHHKLWDGDLGLIKATEHRIVLKPGAKPVRLSPYRMGPASRELTRKQVQRMVV
ncbi:hypothetical protein MMPV_009796 [Pyropia vietnamensis]